MKLLIFLTGVIFFASVQLKAAGSESFSDFDPKLGPDLESKLDAPDEITKDPPPPQIMDDALNNSSKEVVPEDHPEQDASRKYKPRFKNANHSKKHKSVAVSKKKKTVANKKEEKHKKFVAKDSSSSLRKPASTKKSGKWMLCTPG